MQTDTIEQIARSIRSSARAAHFADIPDVVELADVRAHAEVSAELVAARLSAAPLWADHFPMRKTDGTLRQFTVLDHLDPYAYRYRVGQAIAPLDHRLGAGVLSYRMSSRPPDWTTTDFRRISKAREQRTRGLLSESAATGLALWDVRTYFPSIDADLLLDSLLDAHVGAKSARAIVEFVKRSSAHTGIPGLPVGEESSGVLGTAFLAPADEAIEPLIIGASRAMDDFWVVVGNVDREEVRDALQERLDCLGLILHPDKDKFFDRRDAEINGLGFTDDYWGGGWTAAVPWQHAGVDDLTRFLEAHSTEVDALRKGLRAAATARSADGLLILRERPDIWSLAPRAASDYVLTIHRRHREAAELALEQALSEPGEDSEGSTLFALRAVRERRLGITEGGWFLNIALDARRSSATRSFALSAWSRTSAFNADLATDIATYHDSPIVRRAGFLALKEMGDVRDKARRARHISDLEPNLLPTAFWIVGRKVL
ncbi:MAG: RNA-directed DNA polymerase [Actinobacteria bacterium]|nr:RNA-directed DNA polymerase [Actinomycetota bacterium]